MQIAAIEGETRRLGESQGYIGLPIRDEAQLCSVSGAVNVMISEWVPSTEERAALAAGSSIFLELHGFAHPPVMLRIGEREACPFTKEMF